MKRVRITLDPPDAARPPVYDRLTRETDFISNVRIVNWNVANPPVGFLLRFEGEYGRFADELAADEDVAEFDIIPLSDRECLCYLSGETGAAARVLFENFTRGSLLTVPPVLCHDDGSSTFTLVGTDGDIQTAVDDLPAGVEVTVEGVGGERLTPDSVRGRLSPRQREAVETAVAVGYYTVPRRATLEDVAAELGCASTTAAEHLRKAEATVFGALFAVKS